jgi:hypothetical protein
MTKSLGDGNKVLSLGLLRLQAADVFSVSHPLFNRERLTVW